MRRLLFLGGLLGAFLLAPSAFGADGDECKGHDGVEIKGWTKGPWIPLRCVQLCDGKLEADDTDDCTEYDFGDSPGMPDLIVIEYEEDAETTVDGASACDSAPDITITTGPISTGGTSGDYPEYSPEATALILNPTVNRILINTETSHLDQYLFLELNDLSACSNGGVDVRMFLNARKNKL